VGQVRPLPGTRELLEHLTRSAVPWAIATSGWMASARPALEMLGVGGDVPVITRDQVRHAKPGDDELMRAGAYRVYQDPADLLQHLDELGVRSS
jgi:phosphoglycolate phosphatase-like HAD superfamily hydrolase